MGNEELATPEQLENGTTVAAAGIEAAAAQPTAAKAKAAAKRGMQQQAQKVQIELSDEDAEKLATVLIRQMEAAGAFEAPPEPVHAPPAVTVPDAPGPSQQAPPAEPAKKSFAERFRGK